MAAHRDNLALDTSCMVALVCAWHEHHEATVVPLDEALERGAQLVLVGHALVEAYAVLTRLPPPHRISPSDAMSTLAGSFRGARLANLGAGKTWSMLQRLATSGIAGGRTYDALVASAALDAGASRLVTWNPRHFVAWETEDFRVVTPADL